MRQIFLFPFFFFSFWRGIFNHTGGKDCSTWTRADQWSRTRENEQKIAEKIEKEAEERAVNYWGEGKQKKKEKKRKEALFQFLFWFSCIRLSPGENLGRTPAETSSAGSEGSDGGAPGWEGGWEPQTPALFPLQVSGGSVSFRLLKQLLARRIKIKAKLQARLFLLTSCCWWIFLVSHQILLRKWRKNNSNYQLLVYLHNSEDISMITWY